MVNIKQLQSITTTINQPLRINYIHNINQFISQHIRLKTLVFNHVGIIAKKIHML